jgi:bacillithiol biosynthesis cysteine-adding enzyme BshC
LHREANSGISSVDAAQSHRISSHHDPANHARPADPNTSGAVSVKAHCLPFSQIPHTSRIFSDFLAYTPKAQSFYPSSPHFADWVKEESKKIQYDSARRARVSEILERQNRAWGGSEKAIANLDLLRKGAAAVVTGQQVGLFGGPMFSIYKALTAVKLAEEAKLAGVDAVPIFWLATYDHDLAEVNHAAMPGPDGTAQVLTASSRAVAGAPVGAVHLGEEILPLLDRAETLLGKTEASQMLREAYRPGETLGTAFARLFARLFADWGVIVVDASDAQLHRVAEPIYRAAIERAEELTSALLARGEALEKAGYHQQVKVTQSSALLFTLRDGARTAIHRRMGSETHEFVIGVEGSEERISAADLLARISSTPEQFSPNVLLRPVVQDYVFPTLAYTGGSAEVAYFAQAGVVYEALLGRVTPIVPRYSATIVEPKVQRLLERYGIGVLDTFGGSEALGEKLASQSLPEDLQKAFEAARSSLDTELAAIQDKLARLDRTLVDAGETAVSKMRYQLERLHTQAARAEAQKGELIQRHARILSESLYPEKALQERGIAGIYFIARYGKELLHQLYEFAQSDCQDHRIVEV